jgi:hypothetical protein
MNLNILLFAALIITSLRCNVNTDKVIDKFVESENFKFSTFENTDAEDLALAVKYQNVPKIRGILTDNPELVNFQEPEKENSLLILAVYYNLKESCAVLLEYGANSDLLNKFNNSAMLYGFSSIYAPDDCDLTIPKLLINSGGNLNHIDSTRAETLLMASISGKIDPYNCLSRTKLLIESGADIDFFALNPTRCPVNISIILKKYDVAEMLLTEYGAQIPKYGIKRVNHEGSFVYLSFRDLVIEHLNIQNTENERNTLLRILKFIDSE